MNNIFLSWNVVARNGVIIITITAVEAMKSRIIMDMGWTIGRYAHILNTS
jgi:hypothetical protein